MVASGGDGGEPLPPRAVATGLAHFEHGQRRAVLVGKQVHVHPRGAGQDPPQHHQRACVLLRVRAV